MADFHFNKSNISNTILLLLPSFINATDPKQNDREQKQDLK